MEQFQSFIDFFFSKKCIKSYIKIKLKSKTKQKYDSSVEIYLGEL